MFSGKHVSNRNIPIRPGNDRKRVGSSSAAAEEAAGISNSSSGRSSAASQLPSHQEGAEDVEEAGEERSQGVDEQRVSARGPPRHRVSAQVVRGQQRLVQGLWDFVVEKFIFSFLQAIF